MTELLRQAGIDAMEFAGSAGAFVLTDQIQSWILNRADIFLRRINDTTFKELSQAFADSLAAEEGREGLINRIQNTYGNINKARAGLIARTEVHNSTQYGTIQGYKQGGLTIKIWVAVMDGATRDSHAAVDGEERPIDRPFSNGLMFPGDPNGPAEEVINCRCVI
jgi:SPP1 gp7 family putative phage head morphogenesis protein